MSKSRLNILQRIWFILWKMWSTRHLCLSKSAPSRIFFELVPWLKTRLMYLCTYKFDSFRSILEKNIESNCITNMFLWKQTKLYKMKWKCLPKKSKTSCFKLFPWHTAPIAVVFLLTRSIYLCLKELLNIFRFMHSN